jgi:hypothetical protein
MAKQLEITMKKQIGLAIILLHLAIPGALAADLLEVSLGYSHVIGPVGKMATVIIGNDGIADATLGGGSTIILTGKALGATNLIVLDEMGQEVLASLIHVVPQDRRPTTTVRVVNGVSKSIDYVCGLQSGCILIAGQDATPDAPLVVESGNSNGTTIETPSPNDQTPEKQTSEEQVSLKP